MSRTLREIVESYLNETQDGVATLKEIYSVVGEQWETTCETWKESTRAVVQRDKNLKRIGKGVYFLKGKTSSSLLINGDSRTLEEISDGSIDGCIINDHPWSDPKAHHSGNQKSFADYDTFRYTQEDFNQKARVLKDGCFLAEFLPVESATNWEYLTEIKQMAQNAGFQYYAQCIWRKAPEGTVNNGRTTKGVEQILLFSKGAPRRIAVKGKPYMTRNMLSYEIDIPALPHNQKHHQAEKPLELYKYLIENLTDEHEVCLDQFGGACNMMEAAVELNRFSIVYELSKQFVANAVARFGAHALFETEDTVEEPTVMPQLVQEDVQLALF